MFSHKDIEKMKGLQSHLIKELLKIDGVRLNGPEDLAKRVCNNINISVENMEGEFILSELSNNGICISTGSACSSKSTKVSPVLMAINCPSEFIHGNIRISISKYTTEDEIDTLLSALKGVLASSSNVLREV